MIGWDTPDGAWPDSVRLFSNAPWPQPVPSLLDRSPPSRPFSGSSSGTLLPGCVCRLSLALASVVGSPASLPSLRLGQVCYGLLVSTPFIVTQLPAPPLGVCGRGGQGRNVRRTFISLGLRMWRKPQRELTQSHDFSPRFQEQKLGQPGCLCSCFLSHTSPPLG